MRWSAVWSGSLAGLVIALVASALIAATLLFWDFAGSYSDRLAQVVSFISYACAGGWAALKSRTYGWLNGAAAALGFVLLGIALGLVAFTGPLAVGLLASKMAVAALVGALAGIVAINL